MGLCEMLRQILSAGAYEPWIQDLVAPAQYWHDPFNQTNFVQFSHFLAKINNEGDKVPEYRERLENLENFVLIKWEDDETIIPRESSHFEFYHLGQDQLILPLRDSPIYQENWIGLRSQEDSTSTRSLEDTWL